MRKFRNVFDDPQEQENDGVHGLVPDVVHQKGKRHCGTVPFSDKLKKRQFQIVYSFLGGSIRKLFDGRNAVVKVMILFSILFDKVHIASGFMYMAAERILLGALGGLYEKRRSICGVVVIYYYIFGQVAVDHGCLV